MDKKLIILISVLTILAGFGIFFVVTFLHESFHIWHYNKNFEDNFSKSICLDFNKKLDDGIQNGYLYVHTDFGESDKNNLEEFNTWRELSEKYASLLVHFIYIFGGMFLGWNLKTIFSN